MTLLDHRADDRADDRDDRGPAADGADHRLLRTRAAFLRDVATGVEPILATSIRRRASELELQAWVLELRDGA